MKTFALLLAASFALGAQTAKFPSAVITDKDLKVAVNRVQTRLTANMTASDTAFPVASGTGIVANMLLTIEKAGAGDFEIVSVCNAVGNLVYVGTDPASCPNVNGRGFDGTTARTHTGGTSGATVSAYIDAWHRNADKEELKAIEGALGANLVNLVLPGSNNTFTGTNNFSGAAHTFPAKVGTIANKPATCNVGEMYFATDATPGQNWLYCTTLNTWTAQSFASGEALITTDYKWAPQSPGGTLSSGSPVSINLTPCPKGITDGTLWAPILVATVGTPEVVTPTAGSCTSGAASGTVTITPANNHSAGYTVESATAGIQETILYAPNFSTVFIPSGLHYTYATVTKPASHKLSIQGSGSDVSVIRATFTTGYTLYVDSAYYGYYTQTVKGLGFVPTVTRSSAELYSINAQSATFSDLQSTSGYVPFMFENFSSITATKLKAMNALAYGIELRATIGTSGGTFTELMVSMANGGIAGILLTAAGGAGFAGLTVANSYLQGGLYNVYADPSAGVINETKWVSNDYDGASVYSMIYTGSAGTSTDIQVMGGRFGPFTGTGGLAYFYKNCTRVQVVGVAGGTAGAGRGITLDGAQNVLLANNTIAGGGSGGPNDVSLQLTHNGGVPVKHLKVIGSRFGYSFDGTKVGYVATVGLSITAAAHEDIVFSDTDFYGSTNAIVDAGTLPVVYSGHIGGLSDTTPTVASGATVAFPRVVNGGMLTITGTTGATAVSGLYAGQHGSILATDGIVTFTASGSIGNSFALAQNVPAGWHFDGTHLWFYGLGASLVSQTYNYISTIAGANNAITGTLAGVTTADGLCVTVQLATYTLQAGANTFALNGGGAVSIKSSRNPANNIGTGYAATGRIGLCYTSTGPYWLDRSQ